MNWNSRLLDEIAQGANIKNKEAKQKAADKMAARIKDGDVIGVGSESSCWRLESEGNSNIAGNELCLSVF
jgi:ribose 5-phosphate isomerase A